MSIDAETRRSDLTERVAEEIRAHMARRRTSGREMARRLGVSQTWVSNRLTGTQPIDVNDLDLIADALGVPVIALFPAEERAPVNERGRRVTGDSPGRAKNPRPRDSRPPGRDRKAEHSRPTFLRVPAE